MTHQILKFIIAFSLVLTSLGAQATTKLYFIHNDHLGTPKTITDENQQIVWQSQSTPFGETEISVNQIDFGARFPGQYRDGETGYVYNYYRDYDPSIGRYVQSDPIGLNGGLNTYGYVGGNPINLIDPTGEFAIAIPAIPAIVEGIAYYGSAALAAWATSEAIDNYNENQSKPERTPEQEAAAQGAHDWYKHICQQKPAPTGDKCRDMKNEIDRAEMCATLMQQFDDHYGTPGRHAGDIQREFDRGQRLRQQYRIECKPNPLTSLYIPEQCEAE